MELTSRQQAYADAGLAVMARDGMGAVSYRSVAAEAGMSLGAVQKSFATKDELLQAMLARFRAAAAAPAVAVPSQPTLVDWLVALTLQILPLNERSRRQEIVATGFGNLAHINQAFSLALRTEDAELVGRIASLIGRAIAEGEIQPVDPTRAARIWLALVQGYGSQLLYDPRTTDAVEEELHIALSALFRRADRVESA